MNYLRPSFYALIMILTPQLSNAVDFKVEPRLNVGALYYEFEQEPLTIRDSGVFNGNFATSETKISGFSMNDVMPIINGGVTLFVDRFFVDIYGQKAFSGEDSTTTETTFTNANSTNHFPLDAEWDRYEYAISFGTGITENIAVFGGYRQATTEFEFTINTPDDPDFISAYDKDEFEQKGFFVGGVFATPIGGAEPFSGVLTINLAAAFLDGELKNKEATATRNTGEVVDNSPPGGGGFLAGGDLKGDTVGLNVGVSWKGKLLIKGLSYIIGLDGYRYDYNSGNPSAPDFSETSVRLAVGTSYRFF